jgi:LacI family transcriptional regulator
MNALSIPLLSPEGALRDLRPAPPALHPRLLPSPGAKIPPVGEASLRRRNILVAATNPHPGFVQSLVRAVRDRPWTLVSDMLHTGIVPTRWQGDGILAFSTSLLDGFPDLPAPGVPMVTINLWGADGRGSTLQPDHFAIGVMAARHLLERDCRSFIWAPFSEDAANHQRFRGFQAALASEGFDCDTLTPAYRRIGYTWNDNDHEWRQALARRLDAHRQRAGLFAFNDCLARRILAVAMEAHLPVPEQLAIIGVGNDLLDCEASPVPLTCIDPDVDGMTARAVELLHEELERGPAGQTTLKHPPKGIITRESTGLDRLHGSRIHQAIAYITAHSADSSLSVATLAERIGISRRQLERDFRNYKGCTVREYIEDARLQRAARLIIEHPQAKILAIAESIGVTDANGFFRKFRKKFGVTPGAFRRQPHLIKGVPPLAPMP